MKTSGELYRLGSDKTFPRPFQIQSYSGLLNFPGIPASSIDTPSGKRAITEPIVDAIVVPTIRTAEHLRSAVQLAADSRCHLIAVYTDRPPAEFPAVLDGLRPGRVTLLTVGSDTTNDLLDLGASLPQSLRSSCAIDISRKRNLGLLIGHVCGWTRMLFLDDDIRRLNVAKLSSAAALLDDYPVVGLQVNKYPDASVVGHARRLTGRRQEPFVSGGSLLVNPQLLNGYFAPIYHEDWLCIINHVREGQVAIGGSVAQMPYLPFTTPERAKLEEFGDILLSGLLWLLHAHTAKRAQDDDHPVEDGEFWREATKQRFWKQILHQRTALLADITVRLAGKDFAGPSPLPSLDAAQQRLGELKPADFASFTGKWLTSLSEWRGRLSVLPRIDLADKVRAIEKALVELGLSPVVRAHAVSSSRQDPASESGRAGTFASRFGRRTGADSRRRFGAQNEP